MSLLTEPCNFKGPGPGRLALRLTSSRWTTAQSSQVLGERWYLDQKAESVVMVLDFLRRHKHVLGQSDCLEFSTGCYRKTSDIHHEEEEQETDSPVKYNVWRQDPHSPLITLAMDPSMISDTVKKTRR